MSPKVTLDYKENKKQLILDAGRRAFIRKGYELTTMKDIVEESGLSRGGVYLYYSSTEEVFLELLENYDTFHIQSIKDLYEQCDTMWDALVRLIEVIKKEFMSIQTGMEPVIYEYFLSVKRNDKVQNLLNERFQIAWENITLLIQTGIDSGEFKSMVEPEDITIFLLSFMDGLEMNVIHHGADKIRLEKQADQIMDYLRHILMN